MGMLEATFDSEALAWYIAVSGESVDQTVPVSANVFVDLDADGNPVGMEVVGVDSPQSVVMCEGVSLALQLYAFPAKARELILRGAEPTASLGG